MLTGKTALVTGAARGLGEGIAREMAAQGARVTLVDILDAEGRTVEADIEALGQEARYIHCDITDMTAIGHTVADAEEAFGPLDILVNNAGIAHASPVESLEVAIVENIQRDDLNPIEEARGYKRLNEEFKYDHESISKLMSRSRSHISNTLRLLTLPSDVIAMLEEGTLTSGQARPLIGISNASSIAEEIVSKNYSARKVEYLTRNKKNKGEKVIDTNILKTQERIERILGLKVNISNKKNNSGKITIEYKDLEQFEYISKLLKQR